MSYICHIYHLLLLGSSTQILLLKIVLDFEMADSELTQEVRARTLSWLGWAHEVALSHPGTREESTLSKFFTWHSPSVIIHITKADIKTSPTFCRLLNNCIVLIPDTKLQSQTLRGGPARWVQTNLLQKIIIFVRPVDHISGDCRILDKASFASVVTKCTCAY